MAEELGQISAAARCEELIPPRPTGRGRTVEALPIDKTLEILRRHDLLKAE
jgi:hypothetical protein